VQLHKHIVVVHAHIAGEVERRAGGAPHADERVKCCDKRRNGNVLRGEHFGEEGACVGQRHGVGLGVESIGHKNAMVEVKFHVIAPIFPFFLTVVAAKAKKFVYYHQYYSTSQEKVLYINTTKEWHRLEICIFYRYVSLYEKLFSKRRKNK
jgi:hypothetical protein